MDLVKLRPYRDTDKAFVFETFKKGLWNGNMEFRQMSLHSFNTTYQKLIERLIALPETVTTIAALKEDDDVIVGYSITRPETIDWVFVKRGWRKLGIAKSLLAHIVPKRVTHMTTIPGKILVEKFNLSYDPFK